MNRRLSVILPAHNEAACVGDCLSALLGSSPLPEGWRVEVIVVANGCTDDTAARAEQLAPEAAARGWTLQVVEVETDGKPNALNVGDAMATGDVLVYLDADVIVAPELLKQLAETLHCPVPRYGSGRPVIAPATSRVTVAYVRFWSAMPFLQHGVPGFGVFAMNAAARTRWSQWPDVISDDTFARLNFDPAERISVPAEYRWPIAEGFANLVKVRRRQNAGVAEIAAAYPSLQENDDKPRPTIGDLMRLALRDPVATCVYAAVSLAVKTPIHRSGDRWARGR